MDDSLVRSSDHDSSGFSARRHHGKCDNPGALRAFLAFWAWEIDSGGGRPPASRGRARRLLVLMASETA
eukprot:11321853-Alexandrium_andersonii.AAC.1